MSILLWRYYVKPLLLLLILFLYTAFLKLFLSRYRHSTLYIISYRAKYNIGVVYFMYINPILKNP